ncbi:MAG: hypothetical protein FWC83_01295 [Alphaproteobacteria bacterium]|nr:hypothetical protein [Alphaproteobacteria bacterium]
MSKFNEARKNATKKMVATQPGAPLKKGAFKAGADNMEKRTTGTPPGGHKKFNSGAVKLNILKLMAITDEQAREASLKAAGDGIVR